MNDIILDEVKGFITDLWQKLCGPNGRDWLEAGKLFLAKKNPWPETVEKSEAALPALFKSSDTNLDEAIKAAENFAKKRFGIEIDLRERFVIPENLPWKKVLVIFTPGNLTNRDAVDQTLKALKLTVWEETDVMKYSGSEALKAPTLHIIDLSPTPDKDTMNLSPNDLRKTGKSYLGLRGYALGFALHHSMTGEYLDPKETFTWFPEDRLADGGVAGGRWDPDGRRVDFNWNDADNRNSNGGARAEISRNNPSNVMDFSFQDI